MNLKCNTANYFQLPSLITTQNVFAVFVYVLIVLILLFIRNSLS